MDPRRVPPLEASRWEGIDSDIAIELHARTVSVDTVRLWLDTGATAHQVLDLVYGGLANEDLGAWASTGVAACDVLDWAGAGFDASQAKEWGLVCRARPEDADRALAELDLTTAQTFLGTAVTPADVSLWLRDGWRWEDAHLLANSLRTRRKRSGWERSGIPISRWPHWIGSFPTSPKVAAALAERRASPTRTLERLRAGELPRRRIIEWLETGLTCEAGAQHGAVARAGPGLDRPQME